MRSLEEIRHDVEDATDVNDPRCAETLCDPTYCRHDLEDAIRAGAREALKPEPGCEECNPHPHTILICPTHRAERLRALEEQADGR